ncbi:hypothetical protein EBZ38_05595 [bacterium]|nr:hypothetical protein [bacterium]
MNPYGPPYGYPMPPPPKTSGAVYIIAAIVCSLLLGGIAAFVIFSQSSDSDDTKKKDAPKETKTKEIPEFPPPPPRNWAGKILADDGRCGPNNNEKSCTGMKCCNRYGVCGGFKGNNDFWCGDNHDFNGQYDGREP